MDINEKFCPVCKNKNERNAEVCKHCGASFRVSPSDPAATTKNAERPEVDSISVPEPPLDDKSIPDDGLALYAEGTSKPVYLRFEKELVLGRKVGDTPDPSLFDLTAMGGYQMGLSRRHAVIRRVENGYEIVDLSSTNGSWMNNERLVPNKPYRLASGSQLRFGRMRLLVLYHPVSKNKKPDQPGQVVEP